jgi:hypothetical protein
MNTYEILAGVESGACCDILGDKTFTRRPLPGKQNPLLKILEMASLQSEDLFDDAIAYVFLSAILFGENPGFPKLCPVMA